VNLEHTEEILLIHAGLVYAAVKMAATIHSF